ncbi:SGNH hydrolase-type esterase domain-containing protein [Aspergillus stella-maris]|uniref:SGNH hydrolase-type esterase domain-containing protein n=1 Tax=Aspergillus stella-maris TaxID=1810926 RepID=UPI003CCDEA6D
MRFTTPSIFLAFLAHQTTSAPAPVPRASNPPYFITIGDSTVAANGGWGDGFLSFVASPADGVNRGKSGSTTVSWLANGRWEDLVENINETISDYETIVTMQWGHNDQKSLSLDEYEENLKGIVSDLQDLGATPIIITPLSRRNFDGDTVSEDFVEWRLRAIAAAEDSEIDYLDLTTASTDYVNAIGAENAATYDLSEGDGTHINEAGGIVFGRMVADLLLEKRDDLEEYIAPNEELSEKIANGEYATGEE